MVLDGLVTAESSHGTKETVSRLVEAVTNRGNDKKPLANLKRQGCCHGL